MKLLHGDCLEIMPTLADNSVDMVMADVPYGTTACKWDSIIPLEPMWKELKRITKPNSAIVMTASQPFTTTLISGNMGMFKYCWVWEKESGTGLLNAKKQPLRNHEDIIIFYQSQPVYNPQFVSGEPYKCKKGSDTDCYGDSDNVLTINDGFRYPKTIQKFQRDSNKLHPTQKPVALMEYLIKTYTNKGDTVMDFTMGSGTTGVACKATEREFIGIEKDDKYYEIACKRIANYGVQQNIFDVERKIS